MALQRNIAAHAQRRLSDFIRDLLKEGAATDALRDELDPRSSRAIAPTP